MKDRLVGLRMAGVVAVLALAPGLAWSYIDPGNGAYMVQVLFTLAGAALFYIRHPVRFVQALRNRLFRGNSDNAESLENAAELETGVDSAPTEKAAGRSD